MRLAIISSHPIQYYAPLFRKVSKLLSLHVYYAHRASPLEQARAGFGTAFDWDVDLLEGYSHEFLDNISIMPGTDTFSGCDTPQIGRSLLQGQFDAALLMGWHLKSYVQSIIACKRMGIPMLCRGDSQLLGTRSVTKKIVKSITYPTFLRSFSAALYVGQRSHEYYRHYKYPEKRLFFSPHSVDCDWFRSRATSDVRTELRDRLGIRSDANVLLFAGKLLPFKRPFDVIQAASACRNQGLNIEVMIAGDGPLRQPLEAMAQQYSIKTHFLGFCNQTQMPAAYAAADCLVLPSEADETWGLVANEALSCGTPIIVSDACGCSADLGAVEKATRCFPKGEILPLTNAIADTLLSGSDATAITKLADKYSLDAAAGGIYDAVNYVYNRRRHLWKIGSN